MTVHAFLPMFVMKKRDRANNGRQKSAVLQRSLAGIRRAVDEKE
jgi:hypothetical protein